MIEILLANEDRKTDENQVKHELKENGSGIASPPKPENAPVVAPLTIDDMLAMDTSSARKAEDDVSMIVNVDDTQSELDGDMDTSTASALTNDGKLAPGKETNGSSKSDEKPKSSRSDSKKESKDSSQESGKEAASEKEGDSKPSSKGKQRFVTNDDIQKQLRNRFRREMVERRLEAGKCESAKNKLTRSLLIG